MPEPVDLGFAIGLPPAEAIKYFESKGYAISWNWQDVWAEAHAKAFTVAGIAKLDVLQDIRGELDKALANGGTLAEFKRDLIPILQKKGWFGKGEIVDGSTGEIQGRMLNGRRLDTIYRTNMQTAFMAGRYKQMLENADSRPWWEYVAVLDKRTRPSHAALNGRIFRYDDPFWQSFYPPNGWNCRCRVRARSEREMTRGGLDRSSSKGRMTTIEQPINRAGDTRIVPAYKDPATGKTFVADAGFGYNPGVNALGGLGKHLLDRAETASPRLAAHAVGGMLREPQALAALDQDMSAWVKGVKETGQAKGDFRHVGALSTGVIDKLDERSLVPASGLLSVRDEDLLHALRDAKQSPLPDDVWGALPRYLASPRAVLLDTTHEQPALIYVCDTPNEEGKAVVVMDYQVKVRNALGKRERFAANIVRTGSLLDARSIESLKSFELLEGEI